MDAGRFRGGDDIFVARADTAVRDVVLDSVVEQRHVLRYEPDVRTHLARVDRGKIRSADGDPSAFWLE
jgi:hypothetical protein